MPPCRPSDVRPGQTGYDTDQGPAWISVVRFNRTWPSAQWHGKTLRRAQLNDANFYDADSNEEYWRFLR